MIVASMSVAFAADPIDHTVTVTTNGNGTHEYSAFQIFKGTLDAEGKKLSNIQWGDDMTADRQAALVTAIKADSTLYTAVFAEADLASAAKIAEKLSGKEDNGAVAKAFADAVNTALGNATTDAKATTTNKVAAIDVEGDGYYFIKDTGTIAEKDTATRFMLQVLRDISVTAKDTVLTPDKEIVKEDSTDVEPTKDNDAAIGDVIRYNVTLPVPNTDEYKKNFWLEMHDTLEAGLTYLGNMTITINTDPVTTLDPTTNYTTTVKNSDDSAFTPVAATAAVSTTGGQKIAVVFNSFKQFVDASNPTVKGKTITVAYDVVLNKNATFGVDPNNNTVHFEYSNNPNSNYDGEGWGEENPKGTTPNDTTKTFSTTLELDKIDGNTKAALEGAEFTLTGTSWHNVVVTGERFEASDFTALVDGESIEQKNSANVVYYKLKDGSYTTTQSTAATAAQYEDGTFVKVIMNKVVKTEKPTNLVLVTDAEGHINVDGIEQGTYTLKETKAPTGYNLDTTEYKLVIDWTNPDATGATPAIVAAGGFSKGAETNAKFEMDTNGAKFHITIENNGGSTLPSTGGMGTTILYVGGSILVILAAVLLITKRRMSADE